MQKTKIALVRQLNFPCVRHLHSPAWQKISKPLLSRHTPPHLPGKSAHTNILFLKSVCASHEQIPSFRPTVEAQHHTYDVRCQDSTGTCGSARRGEEMQTQPHLDTSPRVHKPAQLPLRESAFNSSDGYLCPGC